MSVKEIVLCLIPNAEPVVDVLIDSAIQEFKDYTRRNDITSYEGLIARMVVWAYNRLGTEGVSAESYSGVSYTYADYPLALQEQLRHCRKVGVIC